MGPPIRAKGRAVSSAKLLQIKVAECCLLVRFIYVGTLNKALFPGMRMGYAVAPQVLLRAFVAARYLMDRQPSTLCQAVVAAFMEEGHFAAHIRRMRLLYRDQRDVLVAALKSRLGAGVTVDAPDQVAYTRRGLSDVVIERADASTASSSGR
jgi:GntR family transcriptional regulator/MocR family aminotransferase